MSVQNILLGNGSERDFNRLNLDSTSKAILPFLHGNSKGEEHVFNVVGREVLTPLFEWEEFTMPLPCVPVALAHCTVHCCSSNCFPHSVSKTLDFSLRLIAMPGAEAKEMWCQKRKQIKGQIILVALLEIMHVPWRDVKQCQP